MSWDNIRKQEQKQTNLDLTLSRHSLYDEVETEEINEVDGQLEELLKNRDAIILLFELKKPSSLNSIFSSDLFFLTNESFA